MTSRQKRPGWAHACLQLGMGLVVSIALSACGGGGGGGGDTGGAAPEKFQIVAPTVADADQPVAFRSTLGSTTGLTLSWDFGDGSTSHEAEPSHRYVMAGNYEVSLAVTDATGKVYKISVPVSVRHLANVAGATCSGADQSGWCWQHPRPSGASTANIWFLDASTGWAVGDAGQILKTSDGGANWRVQPSGVSSTLLQARFADASNGWVLGDAGVLLHTTDGGDHWAAQALGLQSPATNDHVLMALDARHALVSGAESRVTADAGAHWTAIDEVENLVNAGPATVWSFVMGRGVFRSTDAGQHFLPSLPESEEGIPGHFGRDVFDARFFDERHARAYTFEYPNTVIYMDTADGGQTWHDKFLGPLPNGDLSSPPVFFSLDVGWALSSAHRLYRTTDGGANWTLKDESETFSDVTVSYLDASTAYTWGRGDNKIRLTRDGGDSWAAFRIDGEQLDRTPYVRLAGNSWLVTVSDRTYRSADNGTNWQRVLGGDPRDDVGSIQGLWMFDGKRGLATSWSGWLMDTTDGGQTWQPRTAEPGLGKLQFANATNGWMLVRDKGVMRSTDGGLSWRLPAGATLGDLTDFHFIDATTGWVVGEFGVVYKSSDGGETWTLTSELGDRMEGVRFADAKLGLAVGFGPIARTTDGGSSWTKLSIEGSAGLQRVSFASPTEAWAVGWDGWLLHSSDAGLTWLRVPLPTQARLKDIVFQGALNGWIVGERGTALSTTDGGKTWEMQPTGTGKTLWSVYFDDSLTGWMGGDAGTVLSTANGGR